MSATVATAAAGGVPAKKGEPKPRRSHAKVRTGCTMCKSRRIKCDEGRPGCRNCAKHNVVCPGYKTTSTTSPTLQRTNVGSQQPAASTIDVDHTMMDVHFQQTPFTGEHINPELLTKKPDGTTGYLLDAVIPDDISPLVDKYSAPVVFQAQGTSNDHVVLPEAIIPPFLHIRGLPVDGCTPAPAAEPVSFQNLNLLINSMASTPIHDVLRSTPNSSSAAPAGANATANAPQPRQASPSGFAAQLRNLYSNVTELTEHERQLLRVFTRALDLVPALTFSLESQLWTHELTDFCRACPCLLYAVLSYAASWLVSMGTENAGPLSSASMVYRGRALEALQRNYRANDLLEFDAALASILILAEQAAIEWDWQTHILHLRGFVDYYERNSTLRSMSRFATTRPATRDRMLTHPGYIAELNKERSSVRECFDSLQQLGRLIDTRGDSAAQLYGSQFIIVADDSPSNPTGTSERFRIGGYRHLLHLAGDVVDLYAPTMDAPRERSAQGWQELLEEACRLKLELQRWSSMSSPEANALLYNKDPIMLALFVNKCSLDVLIHRCVALGRNGRPTAACPTVSLAVHCIPPICDTILQRATIDGAPAVETAQIEQWLQFARWTVRTEKLLATENHLSGQRLLRSGLLSAD